MRTDTGPRMAAATQLPMKKMNGPKTSPMKKDNERSTKYEGRQGPVRSTFFLRTWYLVLCTFQCGLTSRSTRDMMIRSVLVSGQTGDDQPPRSGNGRRRARADAASPPPS